MRLDKFLKVSRIIKRRTLAKEVCDSGRVMINGKPAKASSEIAIGDELEIRFGQKLVSFRVEQLKETSRKEEADAMYRLLSEKPIE
jgi:ribosomal 50S subunit-recycling heat shock protein